jgi:hypothetical protein
MLFKLSSQKASVSLSSQYLYSLSLSLSVGDGMGNDSGGADSSWVLDFGSIFHVYPQRDGFDSFREVSDGTVTLADGSTLSVVGVGAIRFRMWNGMIRTVIKFDMYLVYGGVLCHSVS